VPSSPDSSLVARARVALGTLVEVALPRGEASDARFAAAFAAVDHVHARMSPALADSDLARIARESHRHAVQVDPQTYAVLDLALAIAAMSAVFDVTVPPGVGNMRGIVLENDGAVRTAAPTAIDLGGIAKGYAVDRAIDALCAVGARAGVVNAGGDLRVFGDALWHRVRLRDPARPSAAMPFCELREHAIATSADYFTAAIVDPRHGRRGASRRSVSVVAPTCAVADALTKVVTLAPAQAPAVLAHFSAQAIVIEASGAAASAGAVAARRLRIAA